MDVQNPDSPGTKGSDIRTTIGSLAERMERLEAHIAIEQLAIRYAMAVDQRDMAAWAQLFTPDINCGRHGEGRDVLRSLTEPVLRRFYRSMHQLLGHRIELTSPDTASGQVYCRAEHEVGDRFIVVAICYQDRYERVDGEWLIARRSMTQWYSADVATLPQQAGFQAWEDAGSPTLPGAFTTWGDFWSGTDLGDLTSHPVE